MNPDALNAAILALDAPTALCIAGAGAPRPWGIAAGLADVAAGRALTVDTPFRTASNTKTMTAAIALRLKERGRLNLDAPIAGLLSPAHVDLLRSAGHACDAITPRQLMQHSAGLSDHADDAYVRDVLADPAHAWTRGEQLRRYTSQPRPIGPPGAKFQYSDTGYVLLGEIIERAAGDSLAAVARREQGFDRLGLATTWWEIAEPAPAGAAPRARQFLGKRDVTDVSATMDLYGGGGLVMSARDLARWTADLFEGRVYERPATLAEMLAPGAHEGADGYRLGLFAKRIGGAEVYFHLGYWGTAAYYCPALRLAMAGFTARRETRTGMLAVMESALETALLDPDPFLNTPAPLA